jgi:hypothetical protein
MVKKTHYALSRRLCAEIFLMLDEDASSYALMFKKCPRPEDRDMKGANRCIFH